MRMFVAHAVAAASMLGSANASAADCARNGRPFVSVRLAPSVPAHAQVLAQLRAGFADRGIGVCAASEAPSRLPVATVELKPIEGKRVSIVVVVADRVTDKRVSREIDLGTLPRDAWALGLALAADEVLRASWAELALATAPPAKAPVPEEVETTVRESLREDAKTKDSPSFVFGAAFAGDLYTGGQRQLGVDARAAIWITARVFVNAGVGLRAAEAVDAPHGTVRSSALVAELGPGLALSDPRAAFGLEALLRGELVRVRYRAEADEPSRGREQSGVAVYGKAGFSLFFAPDSGLRASLELLGGAPIRAINATDSGANATGIDGFGLSAAIGLSGVL